MKNFISHVGSIFPFLGTLITLGLKMTGVIDWPWVWVLGPFWIPAIITMIMLAYYIINDDGVEIPEDSRHQWVDGKTPKECTGDCLIGGVTESRCMKCTWREEEPNYCEDAKTRK